MSGKRPDSSRRDFLQGKAAVRAAEDLARSMLPAQPSDTDSPQDVAASRSYLLHIERRAMACQFEVLLNAGQHQGATEKALGVLDLIDQLEDQLSVYRHRSDVSQLNVVAARREVPVETRLFGLLTECRRLFDETGGAFDITSGPLIRLWRLAKREAQLPDPGAVKEALRLVGMDKVELCETSQSVRFREQGVTIDLGAIGKGYALDRCVELMALDPVEDYMIHGGSSSVVARGNRLSGIERPGWTVGVQHPLRPDRRLLEVDLLNQAIGTSGAGTHQFFVKGRAYGHILDPRDGYPVEGLLSTTVVAPCAALADALSTSFYVMGLDQVQRYCDQHSDVTALVTTPGRGGGAVDMHTYNADRINWRLVE